MNKMVKIGALCLIVALGLAFVGCEDFQKVEFGSVGKVKDITVERAGTSNRYLVTFTGAGEELQYEIFFQPDGAKTWNSANAYADNERRLKISGNSIVDDGVNTNLDKFYAEITLTTDGQNGATKGKVVVGSYSQYKLDKNGTFAKSDDVAIKN